MKSSKSQDTYPKYLFRPGEKWVHVDKFGNVWYEEIKLKNE